MDIKVDFKKMQQDALIDELKLNKYIYIISKVKEYKKLGKVEKDFIENTFKDTYISFYDMRTYCYKRQKNKKKQLSERGEKFFIYFKRLIQEQAKINKELYENKKEKLNENEKEELEDKAKEKLEEIIYVLSTMDELGVNDLVKLPDKDLKQIAKSKIKESTPIHKSFATKLFATLNPKMPVWDNNVSESLQKKLKKTKTKKEQIDEFLKIYKEIYSIERKMLKDEEIENEIDKFKEFFKEAKDELKNEKFKKEITDDRYCYLVDKICDDDITQTKILDFFLWKKATVENNQKKEC